MEFLDQYQQEDLVINLIDSFREEIGRGVTIEENKMIIQSVYITNKAIEEINIKEKNNMYKKLYQFSELLDVLELGMVAESVNLGELNYKLCFNPETFELEYKDYPEQVIKIICKGHKDYDCLSNKKDQDMLFRILP